MKTGNTGNGGVRLAQTLRPQWSPVMKTGNTGFEPRAPTKEPPASMEPGHEDREYVAGAVAALVGA